MSRNEAQTRFDLIDPALFECGWERPDIRIEETLPAVDIVYGKGRRRPKGRTDYVLRRPLEPGTEPMPLAIIEAKREGLPPEHGLQQGREYRTGHLHHVPFVFSSNGHMFVEYDEENGITSEARPMSEFPSPEALISKTLDRRGLPQDRNALLALLTPYAQGRDYLRYYQDAAIRSAIEKIICQRAAGEKPRVLLSLATGAGKTRIAAAFLKRMFDAGLMGRALFVCDRTELRDNGLGDFQAAFGNDAAEVSTKEPQKNARVLIATYQTLDQSPRRDHNEEEDQPDVDPNFFSKHYPADYFDIIVIDECHRSAWGDWFMILEQNANSIQVGLTATPREIKLPECKDAEVQAQVERDKRLLADNLKYFGEAAYEYEYMQGVADGYLAPASLETYDLFHDGHIQPERLRGVQRADVQGKRLSNALTGQRVSANDVPIQSKPSALEAKLILPERVAAMSEHLFDRLLANGDDDPLQKTIIFCAGDNHADLIANEMNNLYSKWCKTHGQKRVPTYAFKCMSSSNGQALIPELRTRQRSHIIATTKDLLTTGVNVPCVRNIVFFRYVQSPILFHQMVGRGTRIDEPDKLMFRIYDYTGATALFGSDFITAAPATKKDDPDQVGEGPPTGPPPTPPTPNPAIKVKGTVIRVEDAGQFNLLDINGRLTRVTPQQYQMKLVEQLTTIVPSLVDFRQRWLEAEVRQEMMEQLTAQGLLPEKLREASHMDDYDLFDVIAAVAYGIEPLTRSERAARFGYSPPDWMLTLPQPTTRVLKAVVRQFERAGTEALETGELWNVDEIRQAKGLSALRLGGNPADLMRRTKETLFAI